MVRETETGTNAHVLETKYIPTRTRHTHTCSDVFRDDVEDELVSRPLVEDPFFFFFCGISLWPSILGFSLDPFFDTRSPHTTANYTLKRWPAARGHVVRKQQTRLSPPRCRRCLEDDEETKPSFSVAGGGPSPTLSIALLVCLL